MATGHFSVNLVVKTASLSITGEEHIKQYSATAESGNTAIRKFCGNCGSPIMTVVAGPEESAFLKGGLFPSGSLPSPKQELFTKRAEKWEKPIDGAQWA
ncbi:uncharacterized protein JCM10292_006486 [Rhodotorula paludigena]|uniref:uncharacterized protein n=1 Tax=Rhodotorula paludigena TaxID=86838 RepID=UPI003171F2AC